MNYEFYIPDDRNFTLWNVAISGVMQNFNKTLVIIIRDSDNNTWIVSKKVDQSGKRKWRIAIDYTKFIDKTIRDKFPLPQINEQLDKLGRANYWSTMNVASGFHQIEIDRDEISKIAFSTTEGHYEFVRMLFGLPQNPTSQM